MKRILIISVLSLFNSLLFAQKTESIEFHLYTDSLKKGTHNYINVDGKLSNGNWRPLTSKEISFTSSYGTFEGNDLILPMEVSVEKLKVKAELKSDPAIWKEITIWIKKKPDDRLPTKDEIMNGNTPKRNKGRNWNK
jgi:hypothetical protein